MIIALLILNILLITAVITMAVFYYRKPKPTAQDIEAEREKKEQQKAINRVMYYSQDIARRANG